MQLAGWCITVSFLNSSRRFQMQAYFICVWHHANCINIYNGIHTSFIYLFCILVGAIYAEVNKPKKKIENNVNATPQNGTADFLNNPIYKI